MTTPAISNLPPKKTAANDRMKKTSLLPLSIGFVTFVFTQLLLATPAKAEGCTYEGVRYDVGQTRGPYVCMPDGTWQPK